MKTSRAVAIDIEDWTAALPRPRLSEGALLALINFALKHAGVDCCIDALSHVDKPGRNWEIARFSMQCPDNVSTSDYLDTIAAVIIEGGDGFDVDWPSTALH